jgi:hypothetical protein
MIGPLALLLGLLALAPAPPPEAPPPGAKEIFRGRGGVLLNESGKAPSPPPPPPASQPKGEAPKGVPLHPLRQAAEPVPGLSYWVELETVRGEPGRRVPVSRSFRSGERIRLHFTSNRDGYIRLSALDAERMPTPLFPNPGKGLTDDRLRAREPRLLPDEKFWMRFDHQPGVERLLVVFAPRHEELDRIPLDGREALRIAARRQGSKGILIEAEEADEGEAGIYLVSLDGGPIVQEIVLRHE